MTDSTPSGVGAVLTLGDGEHRVRFSTQALMDIENAYDDGVMGAFRYVASKPVSAVVKMLSWAEIDGEHWVDERIHSALTGINKLDVAKRLQEVLLSEMGYTEESTKDRPTPDPTTPEPVPALLGSSSNGSIGLVS